MTLTTGLRQLISLRFPSRYSLKAFSRSSSSLRISSGELETELFGEGILGEVYASEVRVVPQGIDDQLEVRLRWGS